MLRPMLALCAFLLAGCSNCPSPDDSAPAQRHAAAPIEFRQFVAVVTVQPVPPSPELLKALLAQLTTELAKIGTQPEDAGHSSAALPDGPWLYALEYRPGQATESAIVSILDQRPYVLITPEDVAWFQRAVTPEALDQRMDQIAQTLDALPAGNSAERRALQQDPLELARYARTSLTRRFGPNITAFNVPGENGAFISSDRSTGLIMGRTASPPHNDAQLQVACERAKERALRWLRTRAGNAAEAYAIAFLLPEAPDANALRTRVSAGFGRSLEGLRIELTAGDEAEALTGIQAVRERLAPWVTRGELAPLDLLPDLIPTEAEQRRNFEALRAFDFVAAIKAFQAAANKRFGTPGLVFFKPFLQRFEKFGMLTREPQPLSLREALQGSLHAQLAPYLRVDADGRVHWTLWYYPKAGAARDALMPELEQALAQSLPAGVLVRVER